VTLSFTLLRGSNPGSLLLCCLLGFAAGIYLFFYGFRLLQRRRLILDTPFSKIRSAAMGMVEISGLAVGPYTMVAPITARLCYYYRTQVWEWKQEGRNKAWVKVATECRHVPFFLDDNTGRLLVDPRGADLDLHRDFQQQFCDSFFTTKDPAPANVHSFLARHGVSTSNKIKVEECCIKPKNSLFILGTLGDNPGIEVKPEAIHDDEEVSLISSLGRASQSLSLGGFSLSLGSSSSSSVDASSSRALGENVNAFAAHASASPTPAHSPVVRLASAPGQSQVSEKTQQQKVAEGLLKAGISNPAAWIALGLGSSSSGQVRIDPGYPVNGPPESFDPRPPVTLMKGSNNKTFLISWRSQQDVARSLGWKCTLMIWGGPVLALLSLYVLLNLNQLFH
jgi:hypothetical protein